MKRSIWSTILYGAAIVLAAYQVRMGIRDSGLGVLNRNYELFRQEQERVFKAVAGEVHEAKGK